MPLGISVPSGANRGSIRKNDRSRTMQLLDATLRVHPQIELRIARERGFELGRDELGEVAAHAFGHAAFGFTATQMKRPTAGSA
jgi:hypothetical protein